MKQRILLAATTMFVAGTLVFTGCSKDDTTPPVITLNGNASVNSSLNAAYTDAGATATDPEDGTVTVTTSGSVNKDLAGNYTITYSATDAAGNTGTETRTVIVANDAAYLAGTYTTAEAGSPNWNQTITASTTVNNRIIFSYFANYSNNNTITASVVGSTVELSPSTQVVTGVGAGGCEHTFIGQSGGAPIVIVGGKAGFSIKFTDAITTTSAGCVQTSAVAYEDIFIQQ